MASRQQLETRLARLVGRDHCVVVGRGATGLWLTMEALQSTQRDKIVIPATLCLSPVVVTRLCGLEPLFCDVTASSGNLCPARLHELLSSRQDIRAVVAAHLYGQPAEIAELAAICRTHGAFLIEDVAQALGAELAGRPLGVFGDAAILSFGHTKILDAGDGGAILTDDAALASDLRARCDRLSSRPTETAAWSRDYRSAYYAIAPLAQCQIRLRRLLGDLGGLFPEMYHYALDDRTTERILAMLDGLDREISHRRMSADLYRIKLDGLPIDMLEVSPGGVPWRFSFTVDPSRRDALLSAIRAGGFDASSWYPGVPPFFIDAPEWEQQWPAAAQIEAGIVNLWVDSGTSRERVLACGDLIRQRLRGGCNGGEP
ncbi:MAG: DegT/DnrJ/EryC1/StrS family aminotransferase [Hyphomicrobiales bacterium]|nr:DegT/DnrJ/EryC1/StrS family aminotransferase [Hyphomicrobiales bacterium]